jgi:hypothetical protein
MPANNPFFDFYAHLRSFPDPILRDLARNESAPHDYRKYAVELLVNRKSPFAKHPDLREFVTELEVELDGIVFEHPAPGPGPLVASITTATIFSDGVEEENPTAPDDSVQVPDTLPGPEIPPEPPCVAPGTKASTIT